MGRHDPKACRRATGRVWAKEKIYRAISARHDAPPVPRGHAPKLHEAREGRAVPARPGPSPTSMAGALMCVLAKCGNFPFQVSQYSFLYVVIDDEMAGFVLQAVRRTSLFKPRDGLPAAHVLDCSLHLLVVQCSSIAEKGVMGGDI